ncbi:MAG: hypothetical protein IH912_08920 [Proteobacteria bacterium]|nr:hypothetical protein [Pseudomonadota bacterium]
MSTKKPRPGIVRAADIKRLLQRYDCPMPYHAVRARFLGSIACPAIDTRPMQVVQGLWDGDMPAFESEEDANELIQALVMGLWNGLTVHQSRNKPFRLTTMRTPADSAGLKRFAQTRVHEIEAFLEGLFAGEDAIDLPETAHQAVQKLGDLRSFFAAFVQFADEPEAEAELRDTIRNAQKLSYIAEKEINSTVQSCTKARRAVLSGSGGGHPSLH